MSDMWRSLILYVLQSVVSSKLRKVDTEKLEKLRDRLALALNAVTSELDSRVI